MATLPRPGEGQGSLACGRQPAPSRRMNHPQTWPLVAALTSWALWFCSWMVAALWSKRTEARPQRGAERAYSILLYLGFALLIPVRC